MTRSIDASALRFLVAGGANTVLTYLIYLGLLTIVPYAVAYSVSFVLGIGISYLLNVFWVFRSKPSVRSALGVPLIYAGQYLLGLCLLALLVEVLHVDRRLAPLIVIAVSVPITYVLTRWVVGAPEKP